jgi:hypothetical protein
MSPRIAERSVALPDWYSRVSSVLAFYILAERLNRQRFGDRSVSVVLLLGGWSLWLAISPGYTAV